MLQPFRGWTPSLRVRAWPPVHIPNWTQPFYSGSRPHNPGLLPTTHKRWLFTLTRQSWITLELRFPKTRILTFHWYAFRWPSFIVSPSSSASIVFRMMVLRRLTEYRRLMTSSLVISYDSYLWRLQHSPQSVASPLIKNQRRKETLLWLLGSLRADQ